MDGYNATVFAYGQTVSIFTFLTQSAKQDLQYMEWLLYKTVRQFSSMGAKYAN